MVLSITKPTRIAKSSATLIDNIFIPLDLVVMSTSHVIIEDMSDHLPVLLVLNGVSTGKSCEHVLESHDLRPKNINSLRTSIKNVDWDVFLSNVMPHNDVSDIVIPQNVAVNELFDKFHNKLQELLDKHVPIRKRVLKEKKYRREPWVTNGLSLSISKSKRLYKKSITHGTSESAVSKYKAYRNCLNKVK